MQRRVSETAKVAFPQVMDEVDLNRVMTLSDKDLGRYLQPIISNVLNTLPIQLNAKELRLLEKRLLDDMTGFGPLEPLLADESINDILVNAPEQVYVERFGKLEMTNVRFRDKAHVMNIISRIVAIAGRRVDETTPLCDCRLADGSRVNVIIPPLALDSPAISIRKFKAQTLALDNLVAQNNMSKQMAIALSVAVKSRLNILVVGGTGSGKTTLLNALSYEIPEDQRIVTIEDAAELQLQQPHVLRLETRQANVEGVGAITERELVKNSLRMRPDRIILGEIRGSEAFDMLQAMNTGHDGSMCTIHASSVREVPSRLANMVMMSGFDFSTKGSSAKLPPRLIY